MGSFRYYWKASITLVALLLSKRVLAFQHSPIGLNTRLQCQYSNSRPYQRQQYSPPIRQQAHASLGATSTTGIQQDENNNNNNDVTTTDNKVDKILTQLTNAFPLFVLGAAILGHRVPSSFHWVHRCGPNTIETMLAWVMVGTGLTLEPQDFYAIQQQGSSSVPLGISCQFGIMPLAAWLIGRLLLLNVDDNLFLGLVLVGCSPGGTASNLVSLIAGANVALSVLLTACSTMLATVVTPLLVRWLVGGTSISVSGRTLCLATARVVLMPVLVGMLLNSKAPRLAKKLSRFTPLASVLLVAIICGAVVAQNASLLTTTGSTLIIAVLGLHTIGFGLGYLIPSKLLGYSSQVARTISIETGMQNSALAVVLAQSMGAPSLAALPGAVSATVHSCLGSILAARWRRRPATTQ